jgi:hypothetical protein
MLNWKTIRVGDIFVLDRAHIPLLALLINIIMSLTGMPVYHFVLLSISFYYNDHFLICWNKRQLFCFA